MIEQTPKNPFDDFEPVEGQPKGSTEPDPIPPKAKPDGVKKDTPPSDDNNREDPEEVIDETSSIENTEYTEEMKAYLIESLNKNFKTLINEYEEKGIDGVREILKEENAIQKIIDDDKINTNSTINGKIYYINEAIININGLGDSIEVKDLQTLLIRINELVDEKLFKI